MQFAAYASVSALLLAVILQVFTAIRIDDWLSILAAVVLIQIIQGFLQPIFSVVTRVFGMLGILLVGFFGYAAIVWAALALVPGIEYVSFWGSFIAAWVYAATTVGLQWVMIAQSNDYFLKQSVQKHKNHAKRSATPGFVFVQLDGVSAPVLEWQLNTGNLPNIKRLIDEQDYQFKTWHTQLPSTTPASQAGILHGSHAGIPAFRWYERESDELAVANQPKWAALIERRISNGKGLLADGGVSIGNLFSGDAKRNIMVMSKLEGNRQSLRAMQEYTNYFSSVYGFMRALVLSIGEMTKEIYQARRQQFRDVQPRVARKLSYVILRAGTNVLLRDLQTTMVIDHMMRGVNSIYVDYLDYDEIAHHAGIARPESLAALTGLDGVVGVLTKATEYAPRPYHIIFVSDHGQSQGQTFRQLRGGISLEQLIGDLLGTTAVQSSTIPIEQHSVARNLLAQGSSGKHAGGSTFRLFRRTYSGKVTDDVQPESHSDIVVTGSGNLGNIWIKRFKKRPTKAELDTMYPGLLDTLVREEGIGIVIVQTEHGPLCMSRHGSINLKTGEVTHTNPLDGYPHIRTRDMLALASNTHAPDIQVVSALHPSTGEVHAFEELVGNHGGIGGWQTQALLLYPGALTIPDRFYEDGELYDSTTIHRVFVHWLKTAGHRA